MTPTSLVHTLTKLAAAAFVAATLGTSAQAQNITASDNASNYGTSANWTTGSNRGTGFGAWTINSDNGTHSISPAANQGTNSATIDSSGSSFTLNATGFVNAGRGFLFGPDGNTFTIDLAHKWDNGNRGFNLRAGGTQIFNFNISNQEQAYTWTGNGSAAKAPWPSNRDQGAVIRITITKTSSGFDYSFSSNQATSLNGQNGSIASPAPDGFEVYISGAGGGGADSDFFFNNLQIVGTPVPTGNRTVAFNVDMSVQESLGNFNSSNGTVVVLGDFNGWSPSNGTIALNNTGNGVYSGNGSIFGSEGSTMNYKFFNTTPGAPNGGYEQGLDRSLVLGPINVTQTVPVVYFSNQLPTRVVTFSVNMSEQITRGNFNGTTGNASVAGEFNGWSTTANLLTSSGNGIYTGNVTVSGLANATLSYKFFNSTPNAPNGGFEAGNDRTLVLGNPGTPQILPTETFRMPLPPTITSAATSNGTVGSSLAYQIVTNPAAAEWATSYALSGNTTLPGGLVLDTSTGLINGTPTAAGNTTIQLTASNAAGSGTPFSLTFSISASGNAYDTWATSYSLTGNSALSTADPDSDGFVNQQEYAFGTIPNQPTPGLVSTSQSAGNFTVTFNARSNFTYNAQTTDNLSTTAFSNNSTVTNSITDSSSQAGVPSGYTRRQFTITPSGSRNFYRVTATQ